jgi:hypothetical protein
MIDPRIIFAAFALAQPQPAAPAPAKEPDSSAAVNRYLEVPLRGEFGKEITAPGIREAMKTAKSKKATAVVLVFDTPGGRVADAQAIAATIDKERIGERGGPDLKVYSVIHRAISASVWPLSHSDKVFFAPGAAAGAAVAFHWDMKTGSAEVDAKFNAAVTAEVAGAAEGHGQPGCAYRAMMLKEARLFGWPVAGGGFKLSDTRPSADTKGVEELDSDTTVLAWTTEQAARYGFGTIMPSGDLASLGPLLGLDSWQSAGDGGAMAMTRGFKECERRASDSERAKDSITKNREAIVEAAKRIDTMGDLASAAEPSKSVAINYSTQGQFSGDTQLQWRQQTDKAIDNWNTVLTLLSDLERFEHGVTRAVDEYNTARAKEYQARLYTEKFVPLKLEAVEHKIDVKLVRKYVTDAISRLNAARVRTR